MLTQRYFQNQCYRVNQILLEKIKFLRKSFTILVSKMKETLKEILPSLLVYWILLTDIKLCKQNLEIRKKSYFAYWIFSESIYDFLKCFFKGTAKRSELCKCNSLLVSGMYWHKRITHSLKIWRLWHLILPGNFLQ